MSYAQSTWHRVSHIQCFPVFVTQLGLTNEIYPLAELAKAPGDSKDEPDDCPPLPQTLVRIPTEHAPNVHAQAEAAEAAEAEAAANESAMST